MSIESNLKENFPLFCAKFFVFKVLVLAFITCIFRNKEDFLLYKRISLSWDEHAVNLGDNLDSSFDNCFKKVYIPKNTQCKCYLSSTHSEVGLLQARLQKLKPNPI